VQPLVDVGEPDRVAVRLAAERGQHRPGIAARPLSSSLITASAPTSLACTTTRTVSPAPARPCLTAFSTSGCRPRNGNVTETYWSRFPGRYFAGDGAKRDADGDVWLLGRVDDVMNISGHRISTTEVESALDSHPAVAEAAVVGGTDATTGQGIVAFTVKGSVAEDTSSGDAFVQELRDHVAQQIGKIAKPRQILVIPELPKTRSGKIMRRLLGDVADRRDLGDVTTLADPTVMNLIGERMKAPGRRGRGLTAGSAEQSGPGGSMVERHQGTSSGAARPVGAAARGRDRRRHPAPGRRLRSRDGRHGRDSIEAPRRHRPARGARAQAHCDAVTAGIFAAPLLVSMCYHNCATPQSVRGGAPIFPVTVG